MVKDTTRVRTRLSALFPKAAGLTKERIDALAAKLKVTDESTDEELDAELTERNDNGFSTFEELKVEDDRIRNEMAKLKKPAAQEAKPEKKEEPDEDEKSPFLKRLAELEAKLTKKEEAEAQRSLEVKFRADERLKGVPEWAIGNNIPKTEEELESTVVKIAEDFKAFADEHKLASFGGDTPPASHRTPSGKDIVEAKKEDTDKIASALLGNR